MCGIAIRHVLLAPPDEQSPDEPLSDEPSPDEPSPDEPPPDEPSLESPKATTLCVISSPPCKVAKMCDCLAVGYRRLVHNCIYNPDDFRFAPLALKPPMFDGWCIVEAACLLVLSLSLFCKAPSPLESRVFLCACLCIALKNGVDSPLVFPGLSRIWRIRNAKLAVVYHTLFELHTRTWHHCELDQRWLHRSIENFELAIVKSNEPVFKVLTFTPTARVEIFLHDTLGFDTDSADAMRCIVSLRNASTFYVLSMLRSNKEWMRALVVGGTEELVHTLALIVLKSLVVCNRCRDTCFQIPKYALHWLQNQRSLHSLALCVLTNVLDTCDSNCDESLHPVCGALVARRTMRNVARCLNGQRRQR